MEPKFKKHQQISYWTKSFEPPYTGIVTEVRMSLQGWFYDVHLELGFNNTGFSSNVSEECLTEIIDFRFGDQVSFENSAGMRETGMVLASYNHIHGNCSIRAVNILKTTGETYAAYAHIVRLLKPAASPKCDCGAESVKDARHYVWCDLVKSGVYEL